MAGLGGKEAVPTEDCLYLSVWAPQRKANDKPKAVLVWIYGGAFVGGGTSYAMSDGAKLAQNEDVVVVAGNYRLSIFGYPGGPGLPDQNPGLLDQRSTVEWVRDNIAGFGGDPSRIVLVNPTKCDAVPLLMTVSSLERAQGAFPWIFTPMLGQKIPLSRDSFQNPVLPPSVD
jgi:hypothetical protein